MGSYVCLPSCVPHASTVLSKHRVGVELLFCLGFWDRGRACARGGAGYAFFRVLWAVWVGASGDGAPVFDLQIVAAVRTRCARGATTPSECLLRAGGD